MGLRHVFGDGRMATSLVAAGMRRDSPALRVDFDRTGRDASLGVFVVDPELVGDRVEVAGDLDVVVDVDRAALPLGVDESAGQRKELGLVEALEQLPPTCTRSASSCC